MLHCVKPIVEIKMKANERMRGLGEEEKEEEWVEKENWLCITVTWEQLRSTRGCNEIIGSMGNRNQRKV